MEDQKPIGRGLVRKQNVAKREGLEPKINAFKICVKLWRRSKETNVTQTGDWGRRPPAFGVSGGLLKILASFWKNSH